MSPEQVDGRPPVPQSDVWALGVILYELITQEPLFDGSLSRVLQAIRQGARPVRHVVDGYPASLASVVEQCLRPLPEDRPADAQALQELLSDVISPRNTLVRIGLFRGEVPQAEVMLKGQESFGEPELAAIAGESFGITSGATLIGWRDGTLQLLAAGIAGKMTGRISAQRPVVELPADATEPVPLRPGDRGKLYLDDEARLLFQVGEARW